MKKKLIIFLAAALVLCLTVAGTAAYFTTDVKTHNVITSGNVKVKLVELDENGNEYQRLKDAMPGMNIAKVVKARNLGTGAAWVRMKLDKVVTPGEGNTAELDPDLVTLVMESENWVEKDGWYYYEKPLLPGVESYSEPLISSVKFAEEMGNEWQNVTVTITVYMQATQVANNGTSATEDGAVVTLYAVWERMDFTVTFDTQTEDVTANPASKTVTYQMPYGDCLW